MKVTRRTETELELHESPAFVWLVLGVFGAGGAWVLVHEGRPVLAVALVAAAALAGLAVGITTTCRFDRDGGELICTSGSLLRSTEARHPLPEIVGVRTQRSAAHMSRATRVVLTMASGAVVPLTSQFGSGTAEHERAAKAVRAFLGLPEPVDPPVPGFGELFRMALDPKAAQGFASRYAGSIAQHEDTVHRRPDDVDARRQLATALALGDRPVEARMHLEHARDAAARAGNDTLASQLDEAIRRLDAAVSARD